MSDLPHIQYLQDNPCRWDFTEKGRGMKWFRRWREARYQRARYLAKLRIDHTMVLLIDQLRAEEGDSVTIMCDNPSFDGSDNAIECDGDWTGWKNLRFEGESLLECLTAAARRKTTKCPGCGNRIRYEYPESNDQTFLGCGCSGAYGTSSAAAFEAWWEKVKGLKP